MRVYQKDDGVLVIDGQQDVVPIHQALIGGPEVGQIKAIITNFVFDRDQKGDVNVLESSVPAQIKNCVVGNWTETTREKQLNGMWVQEVQEAKE